MKRRLLRELLIIALLFLLLGILLHPDLTDAPGLRFERMQALGNWLHPLLYTVIVYTLLGVVRFAASRLYRLFRK